MPIPFTQSRCSLIGMVHLPPLPGSPASELPLERICDEALRDARTLRDAGFEAIVVENFGDSPFRATTADPHTVAAMTIVARAIRREIDLPLGINVLRNDAMAAVAIATVCDAAFVRINIHTGVYATDQGIIEGRADETLRYRKKLDSQVAILADVHVKHASPLLRQPIGEAAEEAAYRGRADGLIVSGTGTGKPTRTEDLAAVREAVPDRRIFVGSGASLQNVRELLRVADGVIVGTAIKEGGRTTAPVDPAKAAAFVAAVRG